MEKEKLPHKIEGTPKEARAAFYELAKDRIEYLTNEEFIKLNRDVEGNKTRLSPAMNLVNPEFFQEGDNLEKWVDMLEITVNKDAFKINKKDYSDLMPFVVEHEIWEAWLRAKKGVAPALSREKKHILAHRRAFLLAEQEGLGDKLLEWTKLISPPCYVKNTKQCEYALQVAKKKLGRLKPKSENEAIQEKSHARLKEASHTTLNDRSLETYEEELGIPITKEFLGEKVLDLGSGEKAKFAKEAAKRGIQVCSLSPDLSYKKHRDILKEGLEEKEKKFFAAGLAQELPFKSNVFDSVLSMWAVPYYIEKDQEEQEIALREIIRVLKPGGRAFLSPVYEERVPFIEEASKKIKKEKLADIRLVKDKYKKVCKNVIITKSKEKK